MNIVHIKNLKLGDILIKKLTVVTDTNDQIILWPMLWSIHMNQTGVGYKWIIKGKGRKGINRKSYGRVSDVNLEFNDSYISENTVKNYINHIYIFLKYINNNPPENCGNGVHNTELISEKYINNYINNILPYFLKSASSVIAHRAAIECYQNFLYLIQIRKSTEIVLSRKTIQKIAENDDRIRGISYICKKDRSELLKHCKTKRDRIILRLGFEVGLRASEIRGLTLPDIKSKNITHKGLFSLFSELEKDIDKSSFQYILNGKYTKRGRSRIIYIDRELLTAMYDYYNTERKQIEIISQIKCDNLLIRTDQQGMGKCVGKCQASNIFKKIKIYVNNIFKNARYHDLRHTFATELYHSELLDKSGQETRSESAALQTVSDRLGHRSTKSTLIYIKMRLTMLTMEEIYE